MQSEKERWRKRARQALQAYFHRHSSPRSTLALVLAVSGLAGFLVSVIFLRLGVETMAVRYPVAALAAWCCLLALIRL